MRFITGYRRHTNAFLYEVTALTRDQLEQLIELEVQWLAPSRPYGERVLINVPGEATVDEILAELQLKVDIPPEEAGPLRYVPPACHNQLLPLSLIRPPSRSLTVAAC